MTIGSISPPVRLTAENALAALAAKVAPALGGADPATIVASKGRVHVQNDPSKGDDVEGGVQAPRDRDDQRGRHVAERARDGRHERRAVQRSRGGHRDRRHEGEEDRLRPGYGPAPRSADRREPVLRRHHHGHRVRALRAPHPRPQHGADGQPEHGVVPAAGAVGHSRRSTSPSSISRTAASSGSASRRRSRRRPPSPTPSPTPPAYAIRSLPITPERVLAALQQDKRGGTL